MPDQTFTPTPFTPPDAAALAARRQRMQALVDQTKAPSAEPVTPTPVPIAPAADAAVGPLAGQQQPPAPTPPTAPPAVPLRSDKPLLSMQVKPMAEAPKVTPIPIQPQAPATPDPLGVQAAKQSAIDALAKQGIAPSRLASDTVQLGLEQAAGARSAVNKRVADFLRTRGYDEPISLIGDEIDLPATVEKMEAAALTRYAQEAGYPDWFAVPPGPQAEEIRTKVNQQVDVDLRHASTVGRGAIFVDPNPERTEEWLSKLPVTWAVTLASVLPHAQATFTPSGAQLRTEPVIATALRPVGAPVAAAAAMARQGLRSGLVEKWEAARDIAAQAEQKEAAGDVQGADALFAQAEQARKDAVSEAIFAATGKENWRDIFLEPMHQGIGQNPEAVKALVQATRQDPMAVAVLDEMADDIERVYNPDPLTMDAIRGSLWTAGLVADFAGPDLVTPTIAGVGSAARYAARLEGSTTDLLRGAKTIREMSASGADLKAITEALREVYPGMDEALKLRIAARARVQPEVVAQVRALEKRAAEMADRVTKAEQALADAREATDVAATARDMLTARMEAAGAKAELATAQRAITQDMLEQWNAFGESNIARAESLMNEVEHLRGPADREWQFTDESGTSQAVMAPHPAGVIGEIAVSERELQALNAKNAPYVLEINESAARIEESSNAVAEAEDRLRRVKEAYAEAKRLRVEDSRGALWQRSAYKVQAGQTVEQVRAATTKVVDDAEEVLRGAVKTRDENVKQASAAVEQAKSRLKASRDAKAPKDVIDRGLAEVSETQQELKRVRAAHEADEAQARAAVEQARKDRSAAVLEARAAARNQPPGTTYAEVEADWADEMTFHEENLKRTASDLNSARARLKAASKNHARLLSEYGPSIQTQMNLTERLTRLQALAAQKESEAGWRVLSVADDGQAADATLENGQNLLRESGLMPDINPLDARSTREMIERGKLWGQGLRDAHAEAALRAENALKDYKDAAQAARGASRETSEAADRAIQRIRDLGEAQYKRELATTRAGVWREEALALADDVERGVVALKRKPRDMSERAINILDGAIIDTAKDGTRTIDTAAFRAKLEQQYTPQGVAWWLRHAGNDAPLWRQALGFEPAGDWNYMSVRSRGRRLTPAEGLLLQQGEKGLLEGLRRTSGDAAALNQVEALIAARRDPRFVGPSFMNMSINDFTRTVANKYEHWKRMLDPMIAKVGDADEIVVRVTKGGAYRAAIARDELLMLGRLARGPQGLKQFLRPFGQWGGTREIIDTLVRYIDTTEPLEVFGRTTIFNRGPEAPWVRGKRQILNSDSLSEASHESAYRAAETGAQTEGDIANKPLLGLSRAWWPASVQMNAEASSRLWAAAIDELKRTDSLKTFMDAMKGHTAAVTGGVVEHIPDRAYSFAARNVAQAAVQADMADMMVRELGGMITAEEAADFNRMITGNAHQNVSMARTWETAARTGAPFTQQATRDVARAVAQQQEMVRLSTGRAGEDIFALATQARALDDTLDRVIKETFSHSAGARNIGEATLFKDSLAWQQWWKSSVTIGFMVPNPRYFMNNLFGNISQIWLTQGLGTAARMTFQGAPSFIPVIGRYFDAAMRATSEAASDVPVLGSMLNSLINPHLNKFFSGEEGVFRAANGVVYDLETMRQWAADDGVLTSFMQEEYGRLFARSRGNGMLTKFRYLQDDLYAWANEIEIRQRAALYLDLLRQGYTRSAARERTLRALYDWHGALTPFESSYITTLIPFYRFMKLGYRQAWYETVGKPFIKPTEATAEALRGSSGLARMRNQSLLMRLPELADDGQYQDEADKFDALAQYRNLDYVNKRVTWTERNDPNVTRMYEGSRGRFLPYSTISLPAATAIDMGNLVALTMYALPAMALGAGGSLGMTDEKWTSPDAMQPFWDEATNMSGPIASPFIALLAQTAGYDSETVREVTRLKPGEAAVAQSLGWSIGFAAEKAFGYNKYQREALERRFDPTSTGPDYQSTVADAGVAALVRGVPGLMQVPQWLDAFKFENPYKPTQGDVEEVGKYLLWGGAQVTNFMRRFPNDPDATLTQHQRKLAEHLGKVADSQVGEFREKQSTPP